MIFFNLSNLIWRKVRVPISMIHLSPLRLFYLGILCFSLGFSPVFAAQSSDALTLHKTFTTLESQLQSSPLKRPALIASSETTDTLQGDLHTILDQPFGALRAMAILPSRWCEVILLLSNTKACRVDGGNVAIKLLVLASSSKGQSTAGATTSEFLFSAQKDEPEYLDIALLAESGPMGTNQLRLQLQAIPLTPARSFLRLHYSYNTSWMGRMAMQTYLQTLGRGKTGFTVVDSPDSPSAFIGGARGVIERNTMRYFLGLECSLSAKGPESAERFQAMADCWYNAVEKYPVQLHEMDRTEYLTIKAAEYQAGKTKP